MSPIPLSQCPLSKKDFMIVEEMADEVLIYDTTTNKLHVLSPIAAVVWKRCDGETSVAEIAKQLTVGNDIPNKQDIAWLALTELEKTSLLHTKLITPQKVMSRRTLVQRAAVATALTLPFITTLTAPSPAHAQSEGSDCMLVGGSGNPHVVCQGSGTNMSMSNN